MVHSLSIIFEHFRQFMVCWGAPTLEPQVPSRGLKSLKTRYVSLVLVEGTLIYIKTSKAANFWITADLP